VTAAPAHVVQVGIDTSVFDTGAASDTLIRQRLYARHLDALRPGSRLTLVVLGAPTYAREISDGGVHVVPVPGGRVGSLRALPVALARARGERSIDVLTTQTIFEDAWVADRFARRHRIPVVGQVHFDFFEPAARGASRMTALANRARFAIGLRRLSRLASVRVVGTRLRQRLLAGGWHDRVFVIPVPVTMAALPRPAVTSGPPVVLFVGRLAPQKDLGRWLAVAARVAAVRDDVEFHVLGDGPSRAVAEARAASPPLAGRVVFHGFVPFDELPARYASATALLLTSAYEGYGRVAAEAAAMGLPVVAPAITGLEDIVVDGVTGFLHEPLDDANLRRNMGDAGAAVVRKRFDPDEVAQAWVSLLLEEGDRGRG